MILITGATGHLGQLVIEELITAGVQPETIVAAVRSPEKAEGLFPREVQVRRADYAKPETLLSAFQGAEKLLLISSNEIGLRTAQHRAVIETAKAAGVQLLAYTSILNADTARNLLAEEHRETEDILRAGGVPYVLLRNGWYFENQTGALQPALAHGAFPGASGSGTFSAASRRDYAAAAAVVLAGTGHENKTYELGGDNPYTMQQFVAEVSHQAGKPLKFLNLPEAEYAKMLGGFGLPEAAATAIASAEAGAAHGELATTSSDLRTLLSLPPTTLAEAVRLALES